MAIVLLLLLNFFGNLQAITHCDKELIYVSSYGYKITCEELSDNSDKMLKDITVSKELILNINNSTLTDVTSDLFSNVNRIQHLSITNSTFSFDADEKIFCTLTNLEELAVENTRFIWNSFVVQGLNNLRDLSLINCSLKIIRNDTFSPLKDLERLVLSRNHFQTILDIPFCELPAVKYVDLDHNEIREIEDDFFLCLEKQSESAVLLNGEDHHIKYRSQGFYSQTRSHLNIIELDLSYNKIEKIGHLDWALVLKKLDLSNNQLRNISDRVFDKSQNLEKLDLKNNLIESIHLDAFLRLKNLKSINLENNTFSGVCLKNLPNLVEANLSKNKLISSSLTLLRNLSKLEQLFLNDNEIQELPETPLQHFLSLELLDLSNNRIVLSQNTFQNLKNLKQLSIRNNRLRIIPDSVFTNLTALEALDISENLIEGFTDPDTFLGLENLQILNMSHNMIEDLSYDLLSPLRDLQVLDISGNRLQNFHVSLISLLPSLRVFNIKSNLLPCSILATIISFLKSKHISFTIHEKFEYDRQNVDGIYCEEISKFEKIGMSVYSVIGILFIVVVSCVLFFFMLYKCLLYSKRRHYRLDELELL